MKPRHFASLLLFATLLTAVSARTETLDAPVAIRVTLTPAGSFVAKSDTLFTEVSLTESAGTFTAKALTLDLELLKTGIALRDKHMLEKYFEIAKFPKATVSDAKGSQGQFTAKLQVHGVSQPISGTYRTQDGRWIGTFKTSIKSFGIAAPKYMGVGVSDDVEVEVSLPLQK